jgi:transcription elongation factor Elf1
VTWLTERPHPLPYAAVMDPNENDFVCPVCDRPMRLATVLNHATHEQTFVLQCRPCGLSTTKTVDLPRQSDQRPPSFAGSVS